jgi:CheY-like chemotaxis protein
MRTVLTADRSTVVRAVIERHLERFGCLAVEATNAAEAIAEARERPLALMVVDAGVHAAASREADPAYDAIPIVLLTTDHPASVPDPDDARIVAILRKPFDESSFDRAVTAILGEPRHTPAGIRTGKQGVAR